MPTHHTQPSMFNESHFDNTYLTSTTTGHPDQMHSRPTSSTNVESERDNPQTGWPSLTLSPETAVFPIEVFPSPLRSLAENVSRSLTCPIDLIASPMLLAMATAIGGSRALDIKNGWKETPQLFLAVVAPPGSSKSPAMNIAFAPIHQQQRNNAARFHTQRLGQQMGEPRPHSNGPPTGATADIHTRERTLVRNIVGDITPLSLVDILSKNPRGILQHNDELQSFFATMNSRNSNTGHLLHIYLSLWSSGTIQIDRKTQSFPTIVDKPFACLCGGIQPDRLKLVSRPDNNADGLLDRFLFTFPQQTQPLGYSDEPLDPELTDNYGAIIDRLYALDMQEIEPTGNFAPQLARFDENASASWSHWCTEISLVAATAAFPPIMLGAMKKLRSYCARFALIIHLARLVCDECATPDVDEVSLTSAIKLVNYFFSHAQKVYAINNAPEDNSQALLLMRWIERQNGPVSPRDLQRANFRGIDTAAKASQLLEHFVTRGLGSFTDSQSRTGRRVRRFIPRR